VDSKSENLKLLFEKAEESMEAAKQLFQDGHYGFSASRSYYAMFYAAQAVLLHKDLQFSKHSAVLSRFNREFVKEGTLPTSIFKSLQKGFELRQAGDYGLIPVEQAEAEQLLEESFVFLRTAGGFLRKEGYDT
jgi:uncharacterized protein (UPF0332 family)